MRLRRTGAVITALAAMAGVMLATAPASASPTTAPYCGIEWGSGTKTGPQSMGTPLVDIRAGRHECYDRLVFDVPGAAGGYWVSYVDQVTEDATGDPVPLRGGAALQLTVYSPAYDQNWNQTYVYTNREELVNVTGFRTFRQVAWAGSWEGTTSVGLGVRARLPFRVTTLDDRVVVDVAHAW
jgi:hypothetical protein